MAMHFQFLHIERGPEESLLDSGGANSILTRRTQRLASDQTRKLLLWLPSYGVAFGSPKGWLTQSGTIRRSQVRGR